MAVAISPIFEIFRGAGLKILDLRRERLGVPKAGMGPGTRASQQAPDLGAAECP